MPQTAAAEAFAEAAEYLLTYDVVEDVTVSVSFETKTPLQLKEEN